MLKVADLQFVGEGKDKTVYNHPTDKGKVIKVMKRGRVTEKGAKKTRNKLRANYHQGVYKEFRRELIQYLQLCKSTYDKNLYTFPVETIYGF